MTGDTEHLIFITECLDLIDEYVRGERTRFMDENVTQDAVLRRLEVLSDACGKLSPALLARHPKVAWTGIAGFRNVLAHVYGNIDLAGA